MDIWVRSQDKLIFEKVSRFKIVSMSDENNRKVWYEIHGKFANEPNSIYERMGIYSTIDQAIGIIDKLQDYLSTTSEIVCAMPNNEEVN